LERKARYFPVFMFACSEYRSDYYQAADFLGHVAQPITLRLSHVPLGQQQTR
jgi:hypothetical protein